MSTDTIKIELTQEEYEKLAQLSYIGNWVVNSHRFEPMEEYEELVQKVYSFSQQLQLEDIIEYDEELEKYYPTEDFETETKDLIQDYDSYTLWEELAYILAERDFFRTFSNEQIEQMKPEEIFYEQDTIAHSYINEFYENGVENVLVLKSFLKN